MTKTDKPDLTKALMEVASEECGVNPEAARLIADKLAEQGYKLSHANGKPVDGTIDEKGNAQPMPRPFRKSGHSDIEAVTISIRG